MKTNIYELYYKDTLRAKGTAREIANELGISVDTVKFFGTPTYQKRRKTENRHYLVKIGELSRKELESGRKN